MNIDTIFKSFEHVNILVVGDVMLDTYLWGSINRISPEAPVPIVNIEIEESRLGGAANVIQNLKSLGATPYLCSVIGDDAEGKQLGNLLKNDSINIDYLIKDSNRPTTKKTRILSRNQQILRFDIESTQHLSSETENQVLEKVTALLNSNKIQVLIFQDYNKGLLSKTLIKAIIEQCNQLGIHTVVDPKKKNFLEYKGVTLFKPNLKEISQALNISINSNYKEELFEATKNIQKVLQNQYSLITLSEKGVFITDHKEQHLIPAAIRDISDVSGAGDTVVAVAALCLALNTDMKTLASLSNIAGGLVCEDVGVVPIDKERLYKEAQTLIK